MYYQVILLLFMLIEENVVYLHKHLLTDILFLYLSIYKQIKKEYYGILWS